MNHCNQPNIPILSKFRGDDSLSASAIQKYHNGHGNSSSNIGSSHYQTNMPAYSSSAHLHSSSDDKQRLQSNSYQQPNASNLQLHHTQPEITQDICNALLNQQDTKRGTIVRNEMASYAIEMITVLFGFACHLGWQSLGPSSAVADYLSHLPASTLPLSLHHFLKYSAESIKKESQNPLSVRIYLFNAHYFIR